MESFILNFELFLPYIYSIACFKNKWNWRKDQHEALKCAKDKLQSSTLLSKKRWVLAYDSSLFGIGGIGSERPVGYGSRTLSQAEKEYSELDKETQFILLGVTKFHSYLNGCRFTIYSDYKPLYTCSVNIKAYQKMVLARVLWWVVTLSAYKYSM